MKNAKHIVKTVLFCGTLAVFSAVSVFSPKEKGSFYENRRLAVFPGGERARPCWTARFSPMWRPISATTLPAVFRCCG